MGRLLPGVSTRDLGVAYGMVTNANDRYRQREDQAAVSSYLGKLVEGQEIDTSTPDYNPLAHHRAMLAHNEAIQNSESVKQQRMKTMQDRITLKNTKFQEAFRAANTARASGNEQRALAILMASYNELYPDGGKLGISGNKIVAIGPDGKPTQDEISPEKIWKMAEQVTDPQDFARSFIGQYSKNKAHNQAILNNPDVIQGPNGQIALRFKNLLDKETGVIQPTIYVVGGETHDEAWAQQNGFVDLATQKAQLSVKADKANVQKARAEAKTKSFGAAHLEEDYAQKKELVESQIFANRNRGIGVDLANQNRTTPFTGLDGKTVYLSNTEANLYRLKAQAASQNFSVGITELNPQHIFTFEQLINEVPELREYIQTIPKMEDKKDRREMEEAVSAALQKFGLDVLAENPDQLYRILPSTKGKE